MRRLWWWIAGGAVAYVVLRSAKARAAAMPAGSGPFEDGIASWYGGSFHGRTTANGEKFDMHAMTAAHKTLKFGTMVRVVDKDTGKSVVVRINDRGPYVAGRVIDLSMAAAEALGTKSKGTARVELWPA